MSAVSNPYIFNIKNNYSSKAEINIAFTSQSWTSPGTYTWVAPFTGTITVCVIGGGGGGATSTSNSSAGNGSQSSFDNIIATGGSAGVKNLKGGSGGSPNGRAGECNNAIVVASYGGQGFSLAKNLTNGRAGEYDNTTKVSYGGQGFSLAKNLTNGSYGSGGSAKGASFGGSASGGSGGCNISQINVIKGQNYQIIVGTGGRAANEVAGSKGAYTNPGNAGAVGIWKE